MYRFLFFVVVLKKVMVTHCWMWIQVMNTTIFGPYLCGAKEEVQWTRIGKSYVIETTSMTINGFGSVFLLYDLAN